MMRTDWLLWTLLVTGTALLGVEQTVYRYQAFPGTSVPSTVSDFIPQQSELPEYRLLPRGIAGDAFEDMPYGRFSGNEAYVAADAAERELTGEFTVSAYLRFNEIQGPMTIASTFDPATGRGLDLWTDATGRLNAEMSFQDGDRTVIESLSSDPVLQSGIWYRVVYRYSLDAGGKGPAHELWLDNERVAVSQIDGPLAVVHSTLPPVFGARRGISGLENYLVADISSAQVDDYPLDDWFLKRKIIRDGTRCFGIPVYHDYLGLEDMADKSGGIPLERRLVETYFTSSGEPRYEDFHSHLEDLWFLPLQNDGYIPQGLAMDEENQRAFISLYHRTADNQTRLYPSVVVEILLPEGELINVFNLHDENNLPMASHVGGIAYWNGFLFVPGEPQGTTLDPDLFVYDLEAVPPSSFDPATLGGFMPVDLPALKRFRDPLAVLGEENRFNSLSFMGVHWDAYGQPYFHTGNFQHEPRPTHLFKLGLAGDPDNRDPVITDPVTLLQSHRRAQGMNFYLDVTVANRPIRRALLANSWGNADSTLYRSLYTDLGEPALGQVYLTLPAGLEDLARNGNHLFSTSESGSLYMQKREQNPWSQLFPFLMQINIADLVDTNSDGVNDEWYAKHGLAANSDPATDPDGDGFSIYDEYLWDTDPLSVIDYPLVISSVLPVRFAMESSPRRFYSLQESTDLLNWNVVPAESRHRGTGAAMEFPFGPPETGHFYRVLVETE